MVKIAGFDCLSFSDDDIVNPDDCVFADESNPHNVRLWILHDHGFLVAAVFADCLQDAIDIAVDEGKMNRYLIASPASTDDDNKQACCELLDYITFDQAEMASGFDPDCPEGEIDGKPFWWKVEPAFLGNAGEPHDIDTLGYVELPAPKASIAAQYGSEPIEPLSFHII